MPLHRVSVKLYQLNYHIIGHSSLPSLRRYTFISGIIESERGQDDIVFIGLSDTVFFFRHFGSFYSIYDTLLN